MPGTTFYDEIQAEPINVLRAALRFAQEIAYPELNVDSTLVQISQLADSAASFIAPYQSTIEQAEALADFLFIRERFRGNAQAYTDPRNSYLNEVLKRRLGIPISLSVLYMAIAERFKLPVRGIGLPGHFIVGISIPDEDFFIDPFHGGNRLSQEDCALLVRQSTGYEGSFQQDWLQPISPRAILTRMLNNLRNVYFEQESWELAGAVVERLGMLQPELPELLRDMGVISHRQGSLRQATQYYEQYLSRAPDAADAPAVRSHLVSAVRSLAMRN